MSAQILKTLFLVFFVAVGTPPSASLSAQPTTAKFVGTEEVVFGENMSSDFTCFKIPTLVAMKHVLFALAEARRGTCSDFDPTELVFRARPTVTAGLAPGHWGAIVSLTTLLNSSSCSAGAGCLPEPCNNHMSNAAPAVTNPATGEVLMVFNCKNFGTYAVKLLIGDTVDGTDLIKEIGPIQTVLAKPPRHAKWIGTGPPASLVVDEEAAVLVPTYFAWHRKPQVIDGLDSYGMTLRYDLKSGEWSVPCAQYGNSRGDVNEHQYFKFNGEVWAFSRNAFYNTLKPRRTLLRRVNKTNGETACFQQVSQPKFHEEVEGCQGSVLNFGESGRVFYTGVNGGVFARTKLTLFEARAVEKIKESTSKDTISHPDSDAAAVKDLTWDPIMVIYNSGSGYSALATVDNNLLGVLYERNPKHQLVFQPTEIVLQRIAFDSDNSYDKDPKDPIIV